MVSQLGTELKRSKYRLLGLIGQGQFGRVFCAVHRQSGRLVALKNLDRQRFPTHKFLRELRFLLSLQHPNIVTCQALEHTATGRYLVMDYCEGGTLRTLMAEDRRLSLAQSLKLVADILAGLEHAHSRGIVHCDIKPENILLTVEPDGWTARVSDFGIARLHQEITNQDFGNTGSPAYMAPERFYGQYSLTSDLYSVGIILFELLTGYRPFSGTPADLMSAHLNRPVKFPDTVPQVWQPIILTALQKLSARRFQSAGDMLAAINAVRALEPSSAELDPEGCPMPVPLLQLTATLPATPLQSQSQELLRHPLTLLAIGQKPPLHSTQPSLEATPLPVPHPTYLYRASGTCEVTFQIHPHGILPTVDCSSLQPEIWHLAPCQTVVRSLLPRPQGCFVVTQQSLHLIPPGIEIDARLTSVPILEFAPGRLVTIDPRGKWAATLGVDTDSSSSSQPGTEVASLTFSPLNSSLRSSQTPVALAAHPVKVSLPQGFQPSLQFLALDSNHVAILTDSIATKAGRSCKSQQDGGTKVRVFTRRGTYVGALKLPVQVGQVWQTSVPYQLLTIDRQNPTSILLIDLKPYRILRLGVEIQPKLLTATSWGYIAADREQLVCLDREGQSIGNIQAPCPITAIAPIEPHGLLVATWDGKQGYLHNVDLRESGVELLF